MALDDPWWPPWIILASWKAQSSTFYGLDPNSSKVSTMNIYWLVVGPPLWKIWVRQLGWWDSQVIWENKKWQPNHQPVMYHHCMSTILLCTSLPTCRFVILFCWSIFWRAQRFPWFTIRDELSEDVHRRCNKNLHHRQKKLTILRCVTSCRYCRFM